MPEAREDGANPSGGAVPQLDTMLRALVERGARELLLREGSQPAFRFAEGDRPVSRLVLNRAQIVTLVRELAPGESTRQLAAGEPVRFVYRLADGRAFTCELASADAGLAARIAPQSAAGETRPVETAAAPARPGDASVPRPFSPEARRHGAPELEAYLGYLVEVGASDLHVSSDEIPMIRKDGDMVRIEGAPRLSSEEAARLLHELMPPRYRKQFEETRDTDFAYEVPGLARFRGNVFADRKGAGGVFRLIPDRIPTPEDLGLTKAVLDLCFLSKGLVLVTGPTGSGKSTTLAAMIDHINRNRSDHIITIEDPIEFVHPNRRCLIHQREVGTHTESFKKALRAALREDPDIVLVGEMRDLETIAIALETAETGHLVFGTLHTSTSPSTVDRIIDQFPADRQAQVRVMLSESLKGVIAQTLLKRRGGGRVAAMEVLIGLPAVSNLIREGKTFQIPSVMQTGRKHGMVLLNDALVDLAKRGVVSAEDAYLKAVDKAGLVGQLKAAGLEVPLQPQGSS